MFGIQRTLVVIQINARKTKCFRHLVWRMRSLCLLIPSPRESRLAVAVVGARSSVGVASGSRASASDHLARDKNVEFVGIGSEQVDLF